MARSKLMCSGMGALAMQTLVLILFSQATGYDTNGVSLKRDTPIPLPTLLDACGRSAPDVNVLMTLPCTPTDNSLPSHTRAAHAAAHDALLEAERSSRPALIDASTKYYERAFSHDHASGALFVLDYAIQLQPHVVQLEYDTPDVTSIACYSMPGVSSVSLLMKLSTQNATDALLALIAPGNLLLNESSVECDGVAQPVQFNITARGSPFRISDPDSGANVLNFTAISVSNYSAFVNNTAHTFFFGDPDEYNRHAEMNRTLKLQGGISSSTSSSSTSDIQSYSRGRGLGSTTETTSNTLYSATLFSLSNNHVYNSNGLSVVCNTCTFSGNLGIISTFLPSSQYAYVSTSGAITLRMALGITLTGGWQASEYSSTVVTPVCIPPLCFGVNLFGIAGFSVGAKVGVDSVQSYTTYSSTSFTLDVQTAVGLGIATTYSYGQVSDSFTSDLTNPQTNTGSITSAQLSVDFLTGLRPKVQIGIWGAANIGLGTLLSAAGGNVAIYGEGDMLGYIQYHAESQLVNYATSPAASYTGYPGCALPQDTRFLVSLGAKYRTLSFHVNAQTWAGCVAGFCAWTWNPSYSNSWNFGDTSPFTMWAACANLIPDGTMPPPPQLQPPPSPPLPPPMPPSPPLPPGTSTCTPYFSTGAVLQSSGNSRVYATCSVYLLAGQRIQLGTCGVGGAQCTGDTGLGLYYPNTTLAAFDDDLGGN